MKFSGKKTHLAVIAIFVLLFCKWQGWCQVPDEVYVALLAAGLSFMRLGVAKAERQIAPPPYTDIPLELRPEYPPQPKAGPRARVASPIQSSTNPPPQP
jgi:hypothetical protein